MSSVTDKQQLFASGSLVGKKVERAQMMAQSAGKRVRVMRRDGQQLVGTTDVDANRINVAVEQGKIVEVIGNG